MAVDPDFGTASNNYVYLYYTFKKFGVCSNETANSNNPVNRVSRFVMSGDTINPSSEEVLIDNIPSPRNAHNAGDLSFGKDGYLYVTVGDGRCDYAGDSGCAGQNDASRDPHVLLGKVLRITRDGGIPLPTLIRTPTATAATVVAPTLARSARRRSPQAYATPSASPSTRTPRAPASSSTTLARVLGMRSTKARQVPTTAGTSARAPTTTRPAMVL